MAVMSSQMLHRRDLIAPAMTALMLAFAGLPLYIHAPRFYAEDMGVGIAQLGLVLLAARMIDSLQDPIIGRFADRWRQFRELWAVCASLMLMIGIAVLFAPSSWGQPLPRLMFGLLAAFTGFSALQIALYDHGLAQAENRGNSAHTRIALWREAGGLVGVCLAAAMPGLLALVIGSGHAYSGYAFLFVLFSLIVLVLMRRRWQSSGKSDTPLLGWGDSLGATGVKSVLVFGFFNALPTAVTATLFLFFVADIIEAEIHAGPMLIVFFTCAVLAAPIWGRIAEKFGLRAALATGMSLSVPVFIWAYTLGAGDIIPFYLIAAGSGAALGADMTLTPAILAARIKGGGGKVFSVWTFLQKTALAFAVGLALPLLALSGYEPGITQQESLKLAYALVPCALKILAIVVLLLLVREKGKNK